MKINKLEEATMLALQGKLEEANSIPSSYNDYENIYEFDWQQLEQIRLGFENGLTPEQVSIYAKPEFDYIDERYIRQLLERNKISNEIMNILINNKFNVYQITSILEGVEKGLSIEQISFYAKPEFDFDRMDIIADGFKKGLSEEQVSIFAKFSFRRMKDLKDLMALGGITQQVIQFYINNKFKDYQYDQIQLGIENKLTGQQICVYADPKFDIQQMEQIREGFENGLTMEQVALYAKKEFKYYQMEQIREGFESGLDIEQVSVYADPKFDIQQMEALRYALKSDLIEEQIKFCADKDFDSDAIYIIVKGFKNGLTLEQMNSYIKPIYSEIRVKEIMSNLIHKSSNKVNLQNIKLTPNEQLDCVLEYLKEKVPQLFTKGFFEYNTDFTHFFSDYMKDWLSDDDYTGLLMEFIERYSTEDTYTKWVDFIDDGHKLNFSNSRDLMEDALNYIESNDRLSNEEIMEQIFILTYKEIDTNIFDTIFKNYAEQGVDLTQYLPQQEDENDEDEDED